MDDQRKAIVGWITVISGGKESSKKLSVCVNSRSLPASLECVIPILVRLFSNAIPCFSLLEWR